MKKQILYIGIALAMCSCGFLDKEPDDRATIDTKKKVELLLASAYELPNYGPLGEVCSDNTVDNNTSDSEGKYRTEDPMSQMYHNFFRWEAVTNYSQQDSPYMIWNQCYFNIAVANQALSAIEEIEAKDPTQDLSAERAEALLIRAYNHFLLANIFCQAYKGDELSKNDLGIHYMDAVETTVKPQYSRGTVTDTYKHIQADLEAALPNVSDDYYSVPKYHFNMKAAYAFAAKFYLFKRDYAKCIEYANKVLGTTTESASAMMWDAATAKTKGNAEQERYCWINEKDNSNLLLCTTMSFQMRAYSTSYCRYTCNRGIRYYVLGDKEHWTESVCWTNSFPGFVMWSYDQNIGSFSCKIMYYFEYTNKVAGIGYAHTMRRELTANELILTRAEAEIMTGSYAAALSDMNVWAASYGCETMKETDITNSSAQYKELYTINTPKDASKSTYWKLNPVAPTLHTSEMGFETIVEGSDKEKYINICLDLRRIETLYDGNRFFDLKRYGISISHVYDDNGVDYQITLNTNDDRYAIQIPQEAILAGHEANPGYNTSTGGAAAVITPITLYTTPIKDKLIKAE